MTEGIRGLDEPVEPPRKPWWFWLTVGLVALGAVLWLYDVAVKTDEEAAAETFVSFYEGLRDGDGEQVCDVISPATRRHFVEAPGADFDCARVASLIARLIPPDMQAEIDELDPDEVEDILEVEGDRAMLSDGDTTFPGFSIVQVKGEWLMDFRRLAP